MTEAGPSWSVAQTHAQANPAPAQAPRPHPVTHIVAAPPWHETGLAELARAYELLLVFTWRQIGVQYKQAVLGVGWAVLSPLLSTLVFTFVFGNLAAIPSEGLPYPLFVLSGLITWQYFARAITSGSNSIWGNSHIITKVYFPRMILPLSAVLAGLVDYVVNLMVLLLLMGFYGRAPGVGLLLLPVFLVLATMIGFALSLWLSALNALYRDIGFMIPDRSRSGRLDLAPAPQPDDRRGPGRALGRAARRDAARFARPCAPRRRVRRAVPRRRRNLPQDRRGPCGSHLS